MLMSDQELEPILDVETRSIRGRACPRCGGKIIPSNTAVFQGQGDPSALFISWQCERCGHLEVFEKPVAAVAGKHAKAGTGAKAVPPASNGSALGDGTARSSPVVASDSKSSDLPPDVIKLLEIIGNSHGQS
jgi:hypothetical protein